jgi:hypothetical protein
MGHHYPQRFPLAPRLELGHRWQGVARAHVTVAMRGQIAAQADQRQGMATEILDRLFSSSLGQACGYG